MDVIDYNDDNDDDDDDEIGLMIGNARAGVKRGEGGNCPPPYHGPERPRRALCFGHFDVFFENKRPNMTIFGMLLKGAPRQENETRRGPAPGCLPSRAT